ncbi:sulfotransferase family protein [Altericroceibacterium xinjiangense]|uniref:sulfotransferase family protein n=1 Tax=Altericroceibacterium xinjiangense TaxID=762261 RepID=UPI001F498251|nr:sulfotransferase [Altericroceibacterium xinjiangense]
MPNRTLRPPKRTPFIDILDTGIRAGRRVGLADPPLFDKQGFLDRARAATGLDDFGDPWFERPMAMLLKTLQREARLNAVGEWAAKLQTHKVLCDRLWAQQWFDRHPEILARPIPRPIVIVGPMRSGTTRLHRLLSSDHRLTHMRSFETISPVPKPDFTFGGPDTRPRLASRIMRVARLANPRTLTIHPTGPMEPEEELGLLVNSFWGMKNEAQWWVPSYGRWCERQDARPAYRQLARLLKLVGWSQQASSLKPWILKTPQHMLDLPALLDVFPDARLIFTHRDPLSVVGSTASLAWNQTIIYSDEVNPHEIGREWLRKVRKQTERMHAGRARLPASRMIDIHYEDMDRDWPGTMRRIYEFLDLEIEPALPAMEHYVSRARALKRRPHQYSLEQFGLTPDRVLDQLEDYVKTYGVAVEDRRAALS